jgi:hypothetical protein
MEDVSVQIYTESKSTARQDLPKKMNGRAISHANRLSKVGVSAVLPNPGQRDTRHCLGGDRLSPRGQAYRAPRNGRRERHSWPAREHLAAATSRQYVRMLHIYPIRLRFMYASNVIPAAANQKISQRPGIRVEMICSATGVNQ